MKAVATNHNVQKYKLCCCVFLNVQLDQQRFYVVLLKAEFRAGLWLQDIIFVEVCEHVCQVSEKTMLAAHRCVSNPINGGAHICHYLHDVVVND